MSQLAPSLGGAKQAVRFLLVGGLNTAVGFAVIWALLVSGISDIPANITGYLVGLVLSFFVNRNWTFEQSARPTARELALFGSAFGGAYSANLAIIVAGQGMGMTGSPALHFAGVIMYTAVFFLLSKAFVYAPVHGNTYIRASLKLEARWPEYITVVLLIVLLGYVLTVRLTHDVSWQFWIARQMLGGVPLYNHIMEINPPLWFWMALPLQQLGTIIGVMPDRLYIIAIFIIAAWSALATGRLLFATDERARAIFMTAIVLLCLLAPINDFGQREQIALILALPYGSLMVKRVCGEPVSSSLALAIGVAAAFGFALKHYFVLVPVVLELWFLWHSRNVWKSCRVEVFALGLSAIAYLACIAIFTPDYFRLIVPMVSDAYQGYEKSWIEQLVRMEVLIWIFAAISYTASRRDMDERDRAIGDMLGLSAVAFAGSYFLQQKGWQYHAIPATAYASLISVHCISRSGNLISTMARRPLATMGAILFLAVGIGRGPYVNTWADEMPQLLAHEISGSSVMILTTDPKRVFPFVDDYNLTWPSRHFAHWMVSAIAQAETGANGASMTPQLGRVGAEVRYQAVTDMMCHPPSLVLSQIKNRGQVINPKRFRMTDFFRRNEDFRRYLANNYRQEKTVGVFEVYRRRTPLTADGANCYNISTAR